MGGNHTLDNITANLPTAYTLEGETEAVELSATSIIQQQQKYYTLGGVRLKFTLPENTLEGAEITANPKFEWKISAAGKLCTDFKYTADGSECETLAADETFDKTHEKLTSDYEFYWEPEKWDNSLDAQGTLTITFDNEDLPKKEMAFKLEKRTLQATAVTGPVPAEPLEGDDVAMLESMLWHLGMSPSANPGARGVRLTDENKKVFNTGTPSVGLMMGRFNYINYGSIGSNLNAMHTNKIGGVESLDRLKQHWLHYKMAYDNNTGVSSFKFSNISDTDKDYAVSIFDGGNFKYSSIYQTLNDTFTIKPSYTETVHEGVSKYKNFERIDILKAMASKEASSLHWGSKSNHRMQVGGSDERGSKGFNQIYNSTVYGGDSAQGDKRTGSFCHQVSGYSLAGESVANHYDPGENLKAKAMFMSAHKGDCGRSFRLAFYTNEYTAEHNKAGKTLKLIKMGTEKEVITTTHKDDRYEQLVKALGAYNQGWSTFNNTESWSELIIDPETQKSSPLKTAMEYGLDILKDSNEVNGVRSNHGIRLPYREYIWLGGNYPADLTDENGNPDPKAGTEWCFKYGEEEWVDGKEFTKIKTDATGTAIKPAIGRLNCVTGEPL